MLWFKLGKGGRGIGSAWKKSLRFCRVASATGSEAVGVNRERRNCGNAGQVLNTSGWRLGIVPFLGSEAHCTSQTVISREPLFILRVLVFHSEGSPKAKNLQALVFDCPPPFSQLPDLSHVCAHAEACLLPRLLRKGEVALTRLKNRAVLPEKFSWDCSCVQLLLGSRRSPTSRHEA